MLPAFPEHTQGRLEGTVKAAIEATQQAEEHFQQYPDITGLTTEDTGRVQEMRRALLPYVSFSDVAATYASRLETRNNDLMARSFPY